MENDIKKHWDFVLTNMKQRVSMGNFIHLFSQTSLVSLEDDIATVATTTDMASNMLNKRFYNDIKTLLDQRTGKSNELLFIIKTQPKASQKSKIDKNQPDLFTPISNPASEKSNETSQPSMIGHLPRVRSEYTFISLAVSDSNRLAFESARTISRNVGKAYNPLFIYGPVGVGKTHLMHAIANAVYTQQPDKKIIYITSEEFTNEVVEAIRNNDTGKMKRRFRSAHLLLIDDIQFIEGKDKVQEELFHTFNILIDQGSQIALSSDRPPNEIKKLEKRLSSRFAGGLTVDIEQPDFELKTAILLKKAEKYGRELPIEVAKLLANNAQDTRSLEGLLLKVITLATTQNEELTIGLAQRSLKAQTAEVVGSLHADDVIKEVCQYFNIKSTQLKGPKRDAFLVKARQITMYVLYKNLGLTYVEVGNILGGRDHTTVIHGVDKIDAQLQIDVHISKDINGIKQRLHV